MKTNNTVLAALVWMLLLSCSASGPKKSGMPLSEIKRSFVHPPDSVRPGVYWYFMDGNLSREAMTADLEAMKEAGIGNVLFLEVNVGLPRGKVDFLSEEWQELFAHALKESKRLGITFTLGVGPGWSGSGGPWVKAGESMRHLVSSSIDVSGPSDQLVTLPTPASRKPFFGYGTLTPELRRQWEAYYEDVAVLAYPAPENPEKIDDLDEKALFVRAPYTSMPGVKQYLPEPHFSDDQTLKSSSVVDSKRIIDLTPLLQPDGRLNWKVPSGKWTILRLGMRNNGAVTRPAPFPGLGFECDKFDTVAFRRHFDAFIGKLFAKSDFRIGSRDGGLFRLHMDSWEMGAQNWTDNFRSEFTKRRGYDPLLYLPVYAGQIVGSKELSERFLWDVRLTAQELVIENHAGFVKRTGRRYGLDLSIQPYDMNPCADLDLGAVADVPSCEFWLKGVGFNSSFSCTEATSIAHVMGRPVVGAEAFTADAGREGYVAYPGLLKNQGDWAFASGINKFIYHTFAHKALGENLRPGMTMGPYGVHWDRGQTWWPMAAGYHTYISRCSYLLQQGHSVADVLYLTPEGAPHVFRPPHSAMEGNDTIPDRKGYNFDGCSPEMLIARAKVKNSKIVFPGGGSYYLLVLPERSTMTPELIAKIESLVNDGAQVVGHPPVKSPGLTNYPECDEIVRTTAEKMWGSRTIPGNVEKRAYGKGAIYWGGQLSENMEELYPNYEATAEILKSLGVTEDFQSDEAVRYHHKRLVNADIYFVSNRTGQPVKSYCTFRVGGAVAELWDPLTGETRALPEFIESNGKTTIPMQFDAYQSYFVVFDRTSGETQPKDKIGKNFATTETIQQLSGPWTVSFDPRWGGPEAIIFNKLDDWSERQEEGIKYYSGIATYQQKFESAKLQNGDRYFLNLGEVKNIARVRLNGKDLGVVWTAPWRIDISGIVKEGENNLEIEVANLWVNRLIGDEKLPDDGIKNGSWPDWILEGKPRTSGRLTFSSYRFYEADSPLSKSGLLGPVTIQKEN